mgnify:CR=1 FL=1
MPLVKLEVLAKAVGDYFMRYHGLAVDRDLPPRFWEKHVGVIAQTFFRLCYATRLNLAPGRHYVVYGNSCGKGYWDSIIKVNGRIIARGKVTASRFLKAEFTV